MARSGDSARLFVEVTADSQMHTNSYVVQDLESRDAVIIDAHMEPALILEAVERTGSRVRAILLTHTDFDHVAGLPVLIDQLGPIPIAVHPAERRTLAEGVGLRSEFAYPQARFEDLEDLVEEVPYRAGSLTFEVLHTPGHSPGGVTFKIDRRLFTGDALFAGSVGRTDLSECDPKALMEAIAGRLMSLEDDFLVCPGHGPLTTIGQERRFNPYL